MTQTQTAKHTPGPWTTGTYGIVNGGEGGCAAVCDTYVGRWLTQKKLQRVDHAFKQPPSWWDERIAEAQSNARLIAAAPDLLAACKALLSDLDDAELWISNNFLNSDVEGFGKARTQLADLCASSRAGIKAARAAIQKAEGRRCSMTSTANATAFKKIVRVGSGRFGSIFVKIKFDGTRLSMTGVEGPTAGGNARGGCGQIYMHDWDISEYAPGWNSDEVARLRQVWHDWHLNDTRPGCVHQKDWNTAEEIELVEYGLTTEAHQLRKKAIERAATSAAKGETPDLSDTERALVLLADWFKPRYSPPDADSPLSGCFEVRRRETKTAGWVYPSQHPRGLLTKECAACGYKYGSAWNHEDVPADVIEWLKELPDADQRPEWC